MFSKDLTKIDGLVKELVIAGMKKPVIVVGTKADLAPKECVELFKSRFRNHSTVIVDNITGHGHAKLKNVIWKKADLIRVYPCGTKMPLILDKGAKVQDFVSRVHTSLVKQFRHARVTGKSAKFPKQQVGLGHELEDEDELEIVVRR